MAELAGVRDKLYAAGVAPEQIIVDPGLGFAKNDAQNWELLQNLDLLEAWATRSWWRRPASASSARLLTVAGKAAAPEERDAATAAITAISAARGAWAVRVHDVGPSLDAVKVAARMAGPRHTGHRPTRAGRTTMDRITLSGVTAVGHHGVFDFERRDGQPFVVDAVLHLDFSQGRRIRRRPGHRALRRGGRTHHATGSPASR